MTVLLDQVTYKVLLQIIMQVFYIKYHQTTIATLMLLDTDMNKWIN